MNDIRKPRKRNKRSKFDPYITEIKALLDTGMPVSGVATEIEPKMDDVVNTDALYMFIKSRGLRSHVTQGGTNKDFNVPHCQKCNNCRNVQNTEDTEVRLCTKSWRMVSKTCQTSPMWCELRKAAIEKFININS